ncbi:ComEA family DNA-binding protein [Streptomyces toyocaensis]|nr:ComEA family DNA-binding protein [Streptomyces toyocaensis]
MFGESDGGPGSAGAGARGAGRVPSWALDGAGRGGRADASAAVHRPEAAGAHRWAAPHRARGIPVGGGVPFDREAGYRTGANDPAPVARSLPTGRPAVVPRAAAADPAVRIGHTARPVSGARPAAAAGVGGADGGGAGSVDPGTPAGVPEPGPPAGGEPETSVGRRVGLAVRERLPLWMQARCGLERRSVVALSALLVLVLGFAVQHFWTGRTQPVSAPEVVRAAQSPVERANGEDGAPGAPAGAAKDGGTAAPRIVVDVSGKVREPGIHRLPAGSRVEDALRAAGGVRPGTRTDTLNRARFLVDGEQVVVGGPAPAAAAPGGGTGTAAGAGPTAPVSLNTATLDQLDALPGVGPVLAQHIVDHRTRNGGFRSVDELREVNGIGDRRFADLRNLVRP